MKNFKVFVTFVLILTRVINNDRMVFDAFFLSHGMYQVLFIFEEVRCKLY